MTRLLKPLSVDSTTYKISAAGAVGCALSYCIGFVMILWIEPGIHLNAQQRLAFILTNGHLFQLWYFLVFIGFSLSFLFLLRGIKKWIEPDDTVSSHLTIMFGFIWSTYILACGLIAIMTIQYLLTIPAEEQSSVWTVIYAIQSGLGEGVEWVGGVWLVLLSFHLLQHRRGPKFIHITGLAIGLTGSLTLLSGFAVAGAIFGITQIVWFILIARVLYRLASVDDAGSGQTDTR